MLKSKLAKLVYLCGLGLALIAWLPATASKGDAAMTTADKNPSPYRKVAVNSIDIATIQKLQEAGAIELTPPEWRDRPWNSTTLWHVPVTHIQRLSAEIPLNIKNEYDMIRLRGLEFYPLAGEPPIPANLRQTKRQGYQMWMLHYLEPQNTQVRKWLRERDIQIVLPSGRAALVVWLNDKQLDELEAAVNPNGPILWTGPYHPYYRLDPQIREYIAQLEPFSTGIIKVQVTLYKHPDVVTNWRKLLNMAIGDIMFNYGGPGEDWMPTVGHDMTIPISELVNIANWYDTYSITPYYPIQLWDEMQGQALAGEVNNTPPVEPNGPGYLAWLQNPARGFTTNPADYPIVGIMDTGLDNRQGFTHPDFFEQGNPANNSRITADTCTPDNLTYDRTGHGTLGAGIIAGYNTANTDANGYSRGLGISPFGRLVSLRVFLAKSIFNAGLCENRYGIILNKMLTYNPSIVNVSLGIATPDYNNNSALFDSYTRNNSQTPNHPLFFSVAAGNTGHLPNELARKVGAPSNAKNVLSVGATMSSRAAGTADGCNITDSGDINEIAPFSSIGPTPDGRAKPDVVAPGVHIQGPAPQDSLVFVTAGVCGEGTLKRYYPAGQTLHTWASGTSFAAPAAAGAAQLTYNYYKRKLNPNKEPSPAMAKALLINSARYLIGVGGNDRLPSPTQGWGMINLGTLFSYTTNNTFVLDQSHVFAQTGGTPFQLYGQVADPTKPVRFSLVWTDVPGQPGCSEECLVNNLDLEVNMVDGRVYLGNVFDTQFSNTGGSADTRNNVENIFLQANAANTRFVVTISPSSLNGDGVPGNASLTDQDFALVIHNATNVVPTGPATTLERQAISVEDGSGGNANNAPEPGELIRLTVPLKNTGNQDAVAVSSRLSLVPAQPDVTLVDERADYPDILTNATEFNQTPFSFRLEQNFRCGTPVTLTQSTIYNGSINSSSVFTVATGKLGLGSPITRTNTTPTTIANDTTSTSTIIVSPSNDGRVAKLKLKLDIVHPVNNELRATLVAPNGQRTLLFAGVGGTQGFPNVTFDDDAQNRLSDVGAPYNYTNGTYRPVALFADTLSIDGQPPTLAGTWRLEIEHTQNTVTQTGTLRSWSLGFQRDNESICVPFTPDAAKFVSTVAGTPQTGAIGTIFLPLQAKVTDNKGNPIRGIGVTFQAPAGGASGTFANGTRTLLVNTNEDGLATASGFRANNTPGSYNVTAAIAVSGVSPAQYALTNVAGEPSSLSIVAGNPQGTLVNSPFAGSLQVRVRDSAGNPVAGYAVTFTPPDTRAGGVAGGIFAGSPDIESGSWTVFSDGNGVATAPTFTANSIAGSYTLVASSGQLSTNFRLSNLAGCPNGVNPYLVTSSNDDGSGVVCGTLSRALLQAVNGTTISFGLGGANILNVTAPLPAVRAGITLDGGSCGANLLTLNGTGVNGVGLQIEGGAIIKNLQVRGFGQPQIAVNNLGLGGAKLSCIRVPN